MTASVLGSASSANPLPRDVLRGAAERADQAGEAEPNTETIEEYRDYTLKRRGDIVSIYNPAGDHLLAGRIRDITAKAFIDTLIEREEAA